VTEAARRAGIQFALAYRHLMPKAQSQKTGKRSEKTILDQAIQQLLVATKAKAKRNGGNLDQEELRKDGFSERFISKVENA
jgi:hypothetical protein